MTNQKMEKPTIEIDQGKLLGSISQDMDGNDFYSFKGIPYAKPPLGKLRFKAPLPPLPWQGIFDATQNGNCCYSKALFEKEMVGSEDCLNLNVYTPSLPCTGRNPLPVMVWIHGGGFLSGSNEPEFYGPEFLIPENVVVVTINYRLGLLGFLSLDNPSAGIPGNAAFKDMVMALKWVNKNIKHFNGDPSNITIFGESAGGVSVHLLMLSPMSQGLFHKAISQSGCILNSWSRGRKADDEMRQVFHCEGKSDVEFLKHLQSLPVEKILENQGRLSYVIDPSTQNFYGLIIERKVQEQGEIPFMCEDPIDIIMSRRFSDVPFIIGYNNMDGMVVNTYREKRVISMIRNFETNIPYVLGYKTGSDSSKMLGQKIKELYFGNETPNANNRDRFYNMVTDSTFLAGIYFALRMHVMNMDSPVYFYRMSLTTSLKFLQALMKVDKDKGAAHADDVAYLFKNKFTPPLTPNCIEYVSIKKIVKLWTNFAYYGNPTPTNGSKVIWKKAVGTELGFLDIDKELRFYDTFRERTMDFWETMFAESPLGRKFVRLTSKI